MELASSDMFMPAFSIVGDIIDLYIDQATKLSDGVCRLNLA